MTAQTASRNPTRCAAALAAIAVALAPAAPPARSAPPAAGTTAAVLSFVDAAGGGVEVVRHWPGFRSDVVVYPFIPYFWDGCPGPGAIMMLITGPAGVPPGAVAIAKVLEGRPSHDPATQAAVAKIIEHLRTPGDPALEALKAAAPWVNDLSSYERWGYAVFLFIYWQGMRCVVAVRAVPEGYGIPFVR